MESIISINELLDESLLIVGLGIKEEIKVEKNYEKMPPILVDKVKLLQVLINLLRNAKDAIFESSNLDKVLMIKTYVQKDRVVIEIKDNGIGISPKNMKTLFYHGFTTKEAGHGFGLHTCALLINELGGDIAVASDGLEKGATFTIHLPNKQPK
jgi:C4-dicarboxylate-specific signal transduction histidine kinase